jgi:hypothetical protein
VLRKKEQHWSMIKGTGPGRTRVGSLASHVVRRGTTLMNVEISQVDKIMTEELEM